MSEAVDSVGYSENDFDNSYTDIGEMSPSTYVGFSQFPDQYVLYRSHMGFTFNLMCVGENGIGKTTLINSLFNIKDDSTQTCTFSGISQRSFTLSEGGTMLQLNISETVDYANGDGDQWAPVCAFLDGQHSKYLEEELSLTRPSPDFKDSRVHCCLYFISPNTRNGLRPYDLLAMSNIATRVNLVPIIGKSDSLTRTELQNLKSSILSSLKSAKIQIFSFSNLFDSASPNFNAFVPFAVVGSMREVKIGHRMVLGRQYPWGIAQVENETHCDFTRLREAVIRTNMEELIETTNDIYEAFRRQRLAQFGCQKDNSISIEEIYAQKRAELLDDIQLRESALRNSFMNKIKEKEIELKMIEKDLYEKHQQLEADHREECESLNLQLAELSEEVKCFNEMRDSFENKIKKKR